MESVGLFVLTGIFLSLAFFWVYIFICPHKKHLNEVRDRKNLKCLEGFFWFFIVLSFIVAGVLQSCRAWKSFMKGFLHTLQYLG